MEQEQIHATCVSVNGAGVILRGPPASGKSDLALRLIKEGGILVADDRVVLNVDDNNLFASAPQNLVGLMEVRGVGIMEFKYLNKVKIMVVVDLVNKDKISRLPNRLTATISGVLVPRILLFPFEASASIKVAITLNSLAKNTVKL